jgi:hypothetical protein
VGGSSVKVVATLVAMTISLPKVCRLELGLERCDPRGDTTLSGVAFEVDATSECVRRSPERWPVEEGEGEGVAKGPDGDLDHDLEAWLDILRMWFGSKPVKREPLSSHNRIGSHLNKEAQDNDGDEERLTSVTFTTCEKCLRPGSKRSTMSSLLGSF